MRCLTILLLSLIPFFSGCGGGQSQEELDKRYIPRKEAEETYMTKDDGETLAQGFDDRIKQIRQDQQTQKTRTDATVNALGGEEFIKTGKVELKAGSKLKGKDGNSYELEPIVTAHDPSKSYVPGGPAGIAPPLVVATSPPAGSQNGVNLITFPEPPEPPWRRRGVDCLVVSPMWLHRNEVQTQMDLIQQRLEREFRAFYGKNDLVVAWTSWQHRDIPFPKGVAAVVISNNCRRFIFEPEAIDPPLCPPKLGDPTKPPTTVGP